MGQSKMHTGKEFYAPKVCEPCTDFDPTFHRYPSPGWKRFQLAGPGSAAVGGIAAVARIGESMEVWWSASNGSVQDAYWYPQTSWRRFELAPPNSAKPGTSFAVVSRIDNSMETWFSTPTGAIKDCYWYG